MRARAQAHYPERLALAVICRPPTLFWLMWTASQVPPPPLLAPGLE